MREYIALPAYDTTLDVHAVHIIARAFKAGMSAEKFKHAVLNFEEAQEKSRAEFIRTRREVRLVLKTAQQLSKAATGVQWVTDADAMDADYR